MPLEKGKKYKSKVPVYTTYGLQPKNVTMKTEDWNKQLPHPIKESSFSNMFEEVS